MATATAKRSTRKSPAKKKAAAKTNLVDHLRSFGFDDVDDANHDPAAVEATLLTLTKAGFKPGDKLDETAQERASMTPPAGLTGKALRTYIETGEHISQQVETGREQRKEQRKASRSTAASTGPREGSSLWACLEVLKAARRPLTANEVYAKIVERKLAPGLKGKTPEQTVAAQLNVAVKRGQHGITRPEPGKFQLQKGGRS